MRDYSHEFNVTVHTETEWPRPVLPSPRHLLHYKEQREDAVDWIMDRARSLARSEGSRLLETD